MKKTPASKANPTVGSEVYDQRGRRSPDVIEILADVLKGKPVRESSPDDQNRPSVAWAKIIDNSINTMKRDFGIEPPREPVSFGTVSRRYLVDIPRTGDANYGEFTGALSREVFPSGVNQVFPKNYRK